MKMNIEKNVKKLKMYIENSEIKLKTYKNYFDKNESIYGKILKN